MQNRRLLVIATTRQPGVLKQLGLEDAFNVILNVPSVEKAEHVKQVLRDMNVSVDEKEMDKIAAECPFPLGIRQVCACVRARCCLLLLLFFILCLFHLFVRCSGRFCLDLYSFN